MDSWVTPYGIPTNMLTYNRTKFISELPETLRTFFCIKHLKATAYHLSTKKPSERFNNTIIALLWYYGLDISGTGTYSDRPWHMLITCRSSIDQFNTFHPVFTTKSPQVYNVRQSDSSTNWHNKDTISARTERKTPTSLHWMTTMQQDAKCW